MLDMDPPVMLVDYIGAGGGLHRNRPVMSLFETVQGRAMRQGAVSLGLKEERVLAQRLAPRLGIQPKPPAEADAAKLAMLNLSNNVGLPREDEALWAQTEPRLNAWMDRYQSLYEGNGEFAEFMRYSAHPFVGLTSYAARPQNRLGTATARDEFPPSTKVQTLRAIGYGSSMNSSGSCALYYYGISKFLGLDEAGEFPKEQLEEVKNLYLRSPKTQDALNRAIYGIAMADMDAAWEFVGCTRKREGQNVTITYNGTSYSLAALAQGGEGIPNQLKVLADIDHEYTQAAQALAGLCRSLPGSKPLSAPAAEPADNLRAILPRALREQINDSRALMNPERRKLAAIFQDLANGRAALPQKGDMSDLYQRIYFAMGTCMECFEHCPAAYRRLNHALALEKAGEGRVA